MEEITKNKMINKLGRHSALYFIGKISSAFFAYLTIFFFVRLAGKEEYGKYSLILSTILFIVIFSGGWINQIILRYKSEIQQHEIQDFFKAVIVFIWSSITIGSLFILVILVNTPNVSNILIIISVFIYLFIFFYSIELTIFQSSIQVKKYIIIELFRAILILLLPLGVFLVLNKLDAQIIITCILVVYFILILFTHSKLIRPNPQSFRLSNKDKVKEYLLFGIPIGFWLGSVYLISLVDKYLITYFIDYESTGVYSAVYDIIHKSLSLIFVPILTAAHPLVMNTWKKDKSESIKILKKSLKYELILLPVVIIGIIILSPILARSIAIDITLFLKLSIPLSISTFCWHISMLLHKPLELNNNTILMVGFAILSLLTGTIINIILIPKIGFLIVAYTSVITALVYCILVGSFFIKTVSK